MRHHPEDVGVAVLAEDFAGAIVMLVGIAVFDAGHSSPWVHLDFLIFEGRIMPRDRGAINRCIGPDRDPESLSRDCRNIRYLRSRCSDLPDVSLAEDEL